MVTLVGVVYVYVYIHMCGLAHVWRCTWRSQGQSPPSFLRHHSCGFCFFFLWGGFSHWSFPSRPEWLVSKPQESAQLLLSSDRVTKPIPPFLHPFKFAYLCGFWEQAVRLVVSFTQGLSSPTICSCFFNHFSWDTRTKGWPKDVIYK